MTNVIRTDGNSDILSVTKAVSKARLEKGDEMELDAISGLILAGHVVDDPSGANEVSESEFDELVGVLMSTRRRQLVNREVEQTQ